MKKIIILLSVLLTGFYLTQAINLNLSSGDKLSISNWQEVSNITDKMNLSSNNLSVDGKLVSSGKICVGNNCLGECNAGYIWDTATNSCIFPSTTPETAGESCQSIYDSGVRKNGAYYIDSNGGDTSDAYQVYCEMETYGGGRTMAFRIANPDIGINFSNNTDVQLESILDTTKSYKSGKVFDTAFTKMMIISYGEDILTSEYISRVNTSLVDWVNNGSRADWSKGTKIVGEWDYISQDPSFYTGITSNTIHGNKLYLGCGVYPAAVRGIGFGSYNGTCSSGRAPGAAWGFQVGSYGADPNNIYGGTKRVPASETSNEYVQLFIK